MGGTYFSYTLWSEDIEDIIQGRNQFFIMEEKMRHALRTWSGAVLLAGCIVFAVGAYYEVIKAGIPYQDPPLELQIQYAINLGIGDALCRIGFFTVLAGAAFRLAVCLLIKKRL